jgi:hypothetical protein
LDYIFSNKAELRRVENEIKYILSHIEGRAFWIQILQKLGEKPQTLELFLKTLLESESFLISGLIADLKAYDALYLMFSEETVLAAPVRAGSERNRANQQQSRVDPHQEQQVNAIWNQLL